MTMSDLIDRNDAVEAIEFEKVYMTAYRGSSNGYVSEGNPFKQYNKGLDDAIKAINSLTPVKPGPKWIPVTEALPEEDIDVLLQFPKNMGVGYQEDGFWNIVTGNDMYSGLDEGEAKPIAWMPLPEPWKGEE